MDAADLFARNDGLARDTDLRGIGLSARAVRHRIGSGRWSRALPGVVCAHTGALTGTQRRRAALLFAGTGAVLSHRTATVSYGLPLPVWREGGWSGLVEVTIPHGRHLRDAGFVVVHQTRRPFGVSRDGAGLPRTGVARTVVDTGASLRWLDDVRALACAAVQRGLADPARLEAELERAPSRGSLLVRQALEEVAAGAASPAEAQFLALVRRASLPAPEMNAPIRTASGTFVLDAYWREFRAAAEIDGRAWHLDAVSWDRDLRRQNALMAAGITLVRFPASRVRREPADVAEEVRAFLRGRAGELGLPLDASA